MLLLGTILYHGVLRNFYDNLTKNTALYGEILLKFRLQRIDFCSLTVSYANSVLSFCSKVQTLVLDFTTNAFIIAMIDYLVFWYNKFNEVQKCHILFERFTEYKIICLLIKFYHVEFLPFLMNQNRLLGSYYSDSILRGYHQF